MRGGNGLPSLAGEWGFQGQRELHCYHSQSVGARGFFKLRSEEIRAPILHRSFRLERFSQGHFRIIGWTVIAGLRAGADFLVTLRHWQKPLCI